MQVFGLPRQITRNGRAASRLLEAKPPDREAERRRDAVARWRRDRADGLTGEKAAKAFGIARCNLYRWKKKPVPKSGRRGGRPVTLDDEKVEQIKAALDDGASKASVCRSFGVARSTLIDILKRVGWTGTKLATEPRSRTHTRKAAVA